MGRRGFAAEHRRTSESRLWLAVVGWPTSGEAGKADGMGKPPPFFAARDLSAMETSYRQEARGSRFAKFAQRCATLSGRPWAFLTAVAVVIIWAVTGPLFKFSDTWQLVINTGTTIITFLMVFLIQNSQNRDTQAIQIKLDELIRVTKGAHVALLDLEKLPDNELEEICEDYRALAAEARKRLRRGEEDTDAPEIAGHLERTKERREDS